jgi:SAM-dependent methyltransferase
MPILNADATQRLAELLEAEKIRSCGTASMQDYLALHHERFSDILRISRSYVPNAEARVLDVGRSELTAYLAGFYKNIHTLGFDPSLDDGGHREVSSLEHVPHITFDLLSSAQVKTWPSCGKFDLIVFSEVIEHLSLAPEYVLAALRSLLADDGILVCTTPNAAALSKRVRLFLGQHPYERLRLYAMNPGHVREYTGSELRQICRSVGLQCFHQAYFNWFQPSTTPLKAIARQVAGSCPPLRGFQLCLLKKMTMNDESGISPFAANIDR